MISAHRLVAIGLLSLLTELALNGAPVRGVVFDDRNHNGTRDAGEPGIPAVAVSNGSSVAITDAEGRYQLSIVSGETVFVIKPSGWSVPLNAQNLPQYYRRIDSAGSTPSLVDFPLRRHDESDRFRALLFTDTQPSNAKDVDYLSRSLVNGIAGQPDFAFSVTLGDVVNDRLDLFPEVAGSMAKIGVPLYYVNGNHDLNLDAADDAHATVGFEKFFGPSTYAFHYGKVLFIAVNDVRYLGGPRYVGGLRENQFAFIEGLLRVTAKDQLVVLMMHIPWFYPNPSNVQTFRQADRDRLFALFKDRPTNFWLSGHTHYQRHVFYGVADGWKGAQPLHEYNVAAACGGFWGGPPDAQGIPISTMWDGTPHGFAILSIDGSKVQVEYRAAGASPDFQVGLHAPIAIKPKTGYISFWANVFNGHDGWKIEARLDDRDFKTISRVLEWDPGYAKRFLDQDYLARPLAGPRLPDPTVCYHLWRGYFPADLDIGVHRLEIRATDPQGKVFNATRDVNVVEPAP